ncbi:hypothetical protein Hanom_Chr16g01454221 [Helianthus anomalus]
MTKKSLYIRSFKICYVYKYKLHVDREFCVWVIFKSKLQKSSFMLITDCKVCPLSSENTKNVLDFCQRPLPQT